MSPSFLLPMAVGSLCTSVARIRLFTTCSKRAVPSTPPARQSHRTNMRLYNSKGQRVDSRVAMSNQISKQEADGRLRALRLVVGLV